MTSRLPNFDDWAKSQAYAPVDQDQADWFEMLGEREAVALEPEGDDYLMPPTLLETDDQVSIVAPKHYEHSYAYPLIIWLHSDGADEQQVQSLMPEISDRNYFGLSFRGPIQSKSKDEFSWPTVGETTVEIEDRIRDVVCQLRREFHIHSERIFLAGLGTSATLALRLMLSQPTWFAGSILFNGHLPELDNPFAAYRDLMGKKILVTRDVSPMAPTREQTFSTARLLHLAGMDVTTEEFETDDSLEPCCLRRIDHWIMNGISSAMLVK